jgi:2-polyprenyl-3-methyl-5-hydroxy-6-metoxy-1,4-benzoquinol methylase
VVLSNLPPLLPPQYPQMEHTRDVSERRRRNVTRSHAPVKLARQADRQSLARVVRSASAGGLASHWLDFGDGTVLEGAYDMANYIHHYRIPEDLRGKTVLDIGTATGYFAIECAARGAQVVATDIWEHSILQELIPFVEGDIRYEAKDIYDLDESYGQFDLVICGSLLLHLPDQLGAIRRIRSVCRGRAVMSTAATIDSAKDGRPLLEFVALPENDGDYWTYWTTSAAALSRMCTVAGFSRTEGTRHFVMESVPGTADLSVPYVALTAVV